MSEATILKIGGSVITDKTKDCTIDHGQLTWIAGALARHQGAPLLVIHGAGSCGHPEARRYGLERGLVPGEPCGIYETHRSVARLNEAVVGELRAAGIEAIGISPLAISCTEAGRLKSLEYRPLQLMMTAGLVPVLHGDVVMDLERGAAILSGDQLLVHLASLLHIRRVGLATDVPGVLHQGSVIPILRSSMVSGLAITGSRNTDVTGGMEGKIQELIRLASHGIESHIFHVSRLEDFMKGRAHGGTTIQGDPS
ncbi:MAG: isopentenyl phosphate kinase family protein [Methanomicrobiales archaeon]|nr:isopentenyl phosphate kinase family protein [Methanomicrobiales archaeon]